jgi:AhpD family alkylhydroperoxidase
MRIIPSAALVIPLLAIALHAEAPSSPTDASYKDIKHSFGFVPSFMKFVPEEALPGAWDEMASLEISGDTALPARTKQLIGLAVAAQIPCRSCIYADTQFAHAAGATDREVREAVMMAAVTRHWSTVLNGMQIDPAAFDKEMAAVWTYLGKAHPAQPSEPVTDAQSAYKDIERTLGSVPSMYKAFAPSAIGPAWREQKDFELNPNTALPPRTKELIGLAVAAQIPCRYCIAFHTAAAKLDGAGDREIQEAVAMSALTRHWSTIINGSLEDENQFRREVDQAIRNTRKPGVQAQR